MDIPLNTRLGKSSKLRYRRERSFVTADLKLEFDNQNGKAGKVSVPGSLI